MHEHAHLLHVSAYSNHVFIPSMLHSLSHQLHTRSKGIDLAKIGHMHAYRVGQKTLGGGSSGWVRTLVIDRRVVI